MTTTAQMLWTALREVLHDAPSVSSWTALNQIIASWPAADKEAAIDYALGHLERWPDWLRSATHIDAEDNPLARHLNLGWMGPSAPNPTDTGPRRILLYSDHINALTISGMEAWQALLELGPLPKIRSLCLMGVEPEDLEKADTASNPWEALRRALPSMEHFVWVGAVLEQDIDLRPLGPLRTLRLVGVELSYYEQIIAVPDGLEALELSGCDNAIPLEHILDELDTTSVASLTLRSNPLNTACVEAALDIPGLKHLDLTHSTLDSAALEMLQSLDDTHPTWTHAPSLPTHLMGTYEYDERGGGWGGEGSELEIHPGEDGALAFQYHWSGWWADSMGGDSDRHEITGLVYVFDERHLLLAVHGENSHFYDLDSFPYVVLDNDLRGCSVMSDRASPNGNYEGPFNLDLMKQSSPKSSN